MYYKDVFVQDKSGLHAVIVATIVHEVQNFHSDIQIIKLETGIAASAKSALSLFALDTVQGTPVRIVASGEDECEAVNHISSLVTGSKLYRL